jgi:hypothetical protein
VIVSSSSTLPVAPAPAATAAAANLATHSTTHHHVTPYTPQGAKIFGDGVWFKTNASALTPEGANILGFGFGLGNNLPALFVSTVSGATSVFVRCYFCDFVLQAPTGQQPTCAAHTRCKFALCCASCCVLYRYHLAWYLPEPGWHCHSHTGAHAVLTAFMSGCFFGRIVVEKLMPTWAAAPLPQSLNLLVLIP